MSSRDSVMRHADVIKTRHTALKGGRGTSLSILPPKGSFRSKTSQGGKSYPRIGKKGGGSYAGALFKVGRRRRRDAKAELI